MSTNITISNLRIESDGMLRATVDIPFVGSQLDQQQIKQYIELKLLKNGRNCITVTSSDFLRTATPPSEDAHASGIFNFQILLLLFLLIVR